MGFKQQVNSSRYTQQTAFYVVRTECINSFSPLFSRDVRAMRALARPYLRPPPGKWLNSKKNQEVH